MHNYKTFDDQINILQERGLIINDIDQAKEILEIHNYYNYASIYFGVIIPVCRIENTLPAIMVERVSCVCGIIFQYQFSVRILAPR